MVRPAVRRALVHWAREAYQVSERRACRAHEPRPIGALGDVGLDESAVDLLGHALAGLRVDVVHDDAAAFLHKQPAAAILIARMLAQRLNVANTYLADLKRQYAGHGTHLAMVGEVLQSMINMPPSEVSPGSDRQSDPRI